MATKKSLTSIISMVNSAELELHELRELREHINALIKPMAEEAAQQRRNEYLRQKEERSQQWKASQSAHYETTDTTIIVLDAINICKELKALGFRYNKRMNNAWIGINNKENLNAVKKLCKS